MILNGELSMPQTFAWFAIVLLMFVFIATAAFMLIAPNAYTRFLPDWRYQNGRKHTSGPLAVSHTLTTRIRGFLLLATTLWVASLMLHKIR
jgi:hypothetical protein